jgi:hypothetical protein
LVSTAQRRSNLELLKLVMIMRQQYERVRKKWLASGHEWRLTPAAKKGVKALADIYVRFNEKQFWHTDAELPALHDLAELLVSRWSKLSKASAQETSDALMRVGQFDPKVFTGEANQGDLWLLWHAELEGMARQEFLDQQQVIAEDFN